MKQMGLILGLIMALELVARAQGGSIDIINQTLKELKDQKDQTTAQNLNNFYQQLDSAMGSQSAAMDLYQQAGGKMPAPTPVTSQNVNETPTEKADREAQDQANVAVLSGVMQIHCGLMRYGGVFVTTPDQKGLQEAWVAWLKSAAQTYPTLQNSPPNPAPANNNGGSAPEGKHHNRNGGGGNGGGGGSSIDFKSVSLKDSIIGKFLGFHNWGDKDQGNWTVHSIPDLYMANVLTPLRAKPTAETLAAWDVYIAMKNADQTDTDKWNQVDYPGLLFERDSDDYSISPNIDKLTTLVEIIKASPNYPKLDDMIARTKKMADDYKNAHSAPAPVAAAPTPAADPNVSVTTTTQGDMTVITTTHSNTPPANPAPPSPPAPAQ